MIDKVLKKAFLVVGVAFPLALSGVSHVFAAPIDFDTFSVPSDSGTVAAYYGVLVPNQQTKTIVLIQDAHMNIVAHRNIAAIIDNLYQEYGLDLVLVESAEGKTGQSHLRTLGGQEYAREAAERYLESGMITGDEYLDMTADFPLTLWGVEDMDLYDANFDAYEQAQTVRESLSPFFLQLNQIIDALEPKIQSKALADIEARIAAFDAEEIAFDEYLEYLSSRAEALSVSLDGMREINRFLNLAQQEALLDLEAVGEQQKALYLAVQETAGREALRPLVSLRQKLQEGKISRLVFYHELSEIAASAGVQLTDYPAMAGYLAYLRQQKKLSVKNLSQELIELQEDLMLAAAQSDAEKMWLLTRLAVESAERLSQLKWLPHDWQAHKDGSEFLNPGAWVEGLNLLAQRFGVEMVTAIDAAEVEGQLNRLIDFYEIVDQRNEAILDRSLQKMNADGEHVAAMVMGGFHTQGLAELFNANNISLMVISPLVGESNDDRYAQILKYKQGALDVSFDSLMNSDE